MVDDQKVSGVELSELTGLSDMRHRQLAKEGFFPSPVRGKYQLLPTIRGLFRYYRESYHNTNKTLAGDRQTKIQKEIELLDLKIREQKKLLVEVAEVDRVWQAVCVAVRQTILAEDLPQNTKEDLCEHFRKIPTSEYYRKAIDGETKGGAESD